MSSFETMENELEITYESDEDFEDDPQPEAGRRKKEYWIPNAEDLKACKQCKTVLNRYDIRRLPKQHLTERHGLFWGGLEKPYIQIFKVTCPNPSCKKKYSYKYKGSDWWYK